MKEFTTRLTRHSSASPEAVYDLLANLGTHLEWGGARQRGPFRLLSMDGPAGPAGEGTSFASTGSIPMSLRRWHDRSVVTAAQRPAVFEFVTHATVPGSLPMTATYRHRYEMVAAAKGCDVSYSFTQLETVNPFLRLALPVVRTMTWRFGIPFLAGRGFCNLLAMAEREAVKVGNSRSALQPTK